jgi:hypothetical protein
MLRCSRCSMKLSQRGSEASARGVFPPAGVPQWVQLSRGPIHMARVSAERHLIFCGPAPQARICREGAPGLVGRWWASGFYFRISCENSGRPLRTARIFDSSAIALRGS